MKALVIRFSSLGDCVLLCPLLSRLKADGAEEVAVVTKRAHAALFEATEGVDRVVALEAGEGWRGLVRIGRMFRHRGYTVIDAHNTLRSRILSWLAGGADRRFRKSYRERLALITFKIRPDPALPTMLERYAGLARNGGADAPALHPGGLAVPDEARRVAAGLWPGGGPAIAIAPGSRWEAKRWPESRFVELGVALAAERGVRVVIVGDASDTDIAGRIAREVGVDCVDTTGTTSILETAAVIERCDALVGNDSGLTHLAEAVGVPAVAVFGPTVRDFGYAPALPKSRMVETDLPCRPCSRNGSRPCLRRTHDCMERIPVDAVAAALDTALSRRVAR